MCGDKGNADRRRLLPVLAVTLLLASCGPALKSCVRAADEIGSIGRGADDIGPTTSRSDPDYSPTSSYDDTVYVREAVEGSGSATPVRVDEVIAEAISLDGEQGRAYGSELTQLIDDTAREDDSLSATDALIFQTGNHKSPLRVFSTVPANESEFAKQFGRDPTQADLNALEADRRMFGRLPGNQHTRSTNELWSLLESDDSGSAIVIVGHNEGGVLRFPDGSGSTLSLLARECADNGKLCLILSCRSNRYIEDAGSAIGLDQELTFAEAGKIIQDVQSVLLRISARGDGSSEFENLNVLQLDAILRSTIDGSLKQQRGEQAAKSTVKVAGFSVTGGLIVYELNSQD